MDCNIENLIFSLESWIIEVGRYTRECLDTTPHLTNEEAKESVMIWVSTWSSDFRKMKTTGLEMTWGRRGSSGPSATGKVNLCMAIW